jgi:hypothetical protein
MANTHKTNKARIARSLTRKFFALINNDARETLNQVESDIKALGVNGKRYGNHRHMKAKEKVAARRADRKALNRAVTLD